MSSNQVPGWTARAMKKIVSWTGKTWIGKIKETAAINKSPKADDERDGADNEEQRRLNVLRADQRCLASLALRASPEAMEEFAEIKRRSPSTPGLPFPVEPLLDLSAFFEMPKRRWQRDVGNPEGRKDRADGGGRQFEPRCGPDVFRGPGHRPKRQRRRWANSVVDGHPKRLRWILRDMPDEFLSSLRYLADASSEETKQQAFDELLSEAAPAAVGEAVPMHLWTCLDALADCGTDEGREKAWAYAGGPDPASANVVRAARLPTLMARREAAELRAEVFGRKGGPQARPQENGVADSSLPPAKRRGGRL